MKLYVCGDSGPSGFGVATRGVVKHLLDYDDIDLTFRTHQWGLNREGIHWADRGFPDTRWAEYLLREDIVNDDYLIEDVRETAGREDDLLENLGTNETAAPTDCMIRQFEGPEDVWLGVGSMAFAEQAPDDPYTIVSTDYNLDIVPRDWEYYIDQIDEVWVPSEWTKSAIENRLGQRDDVFVMPYGVPMDYEPTEYDCEVCPHNANGGGGIPPQIRCLRDGSFNFLVLSRFYHIKGMYRTIKAYVEEFRADEDVRLFIKTTSNQQFQFNPVQSAQAVVNELGYPDPPEIGFGTESLETQYLYDLMGHCDAFVQASRGECFGIAQLQAAWCETPVIYTDWSAQSEVMYPNSGMFPITDYEVERVSAESSAFPYNVQATYPPEAKWAVPSIEAIGLEMRKAFEMSDDRLQEAGYSARNYVQTDYSWENRIEPRVERLRDVTEQKVSA